MDQVSFLWTEHLLLDLLFLQSQRNELKNLIFKAFQLHLFFQFAGESGSRRARCEEIPHRFFISVRNEVSIRRRDWQLILNRVGTNHKKNTPITRIGVNDPIIRIAQPAMES